MRFFFDESGDFAAPASPFEHRAAVVVGVSVSELVEQKLQASYAAFAENLDEKKKVEGEPKGRLLDQEDCLGFCAMLARNPDVYVTPATLDLTCLRGKEREVLPGGVAETLMKKSLECIHDTMREDVRLLGRQFGNLSPEQALRLYTLAYCLQGTIHDSVMFLSCRGHEESWRSLSFEIDAVQKRPGSREQAVFTWMLLGWLVAWSRKHPLGLVEEIHTPNHPFVQLYEKEEGIDFGKIIKGNLHWVDSAGNWGIQVADISASIVYRAVHDLENREGWGTVLGHLMRNSVRGPRMCLGLLQSGADLIPEVTGKYHALCRVVAALQEQPTGPES